MKFFEGETDRLRINGIVSHFEGEPLSGLRMRQLAAAWTTWTGLKFTSDTKTDLGRALEIRFSTKENINEYYYKKMSFLDSTNLSDAEELIA
ncbi:hypothetical protein BLOT_012519 [Blomia tropicalis]|nr:hypothetical protein BLOT_012519 [Blomia tropicalis]